MLPKVLSPGPVKRKRSKMSRTALDDLFHTWLVPYSTGTPVHLRSVVSSSSVCYLSYSVQNLPKDNVVKCPGQFRSIYFIRVWCHPQLVNPIDLTSVVSSSSVCYLSYSVQNLPKENVVKRPGQFRTKFRKHLFHTWLCHTQVELQFISEV